MSRTVLVIGGSWCLKCKPFSNSLKSAGVEHQYIEEDTVPHNKPNSPAQKILNHIFREDGKSLPVTVILDGHDFRGEYILGIDIPGVKAMLAGKPKKSRQGPVDGDLNPYEYIKLLLVSLLKGGSNVSKNTRTKIARKAWVGWVEESPESRRKECSFKIADSDWMNGDAWDVLVSGLTNGLFSLKQLRTLVIKRSAGNDNEWGQSQISLGKEWLNIFRWMEERGDIPALAGLAHRFREKVGLGTAQDTEKQEPIGVSQDEEPGEGEEPPQSYEAKIQNIINDIASILKGEGFDDPNLDKYLTACSILPDGSSGKTVTDATLDLLLGGVATSMLAKASIKGMSSALKSATAPTDASGAEAPTGRPRGRREAPRRTGAEPGKIEKLMATLEKYAESTPRGPGKFGKALRWAARKAPDVARISMGMAKAKTGALATAGAVGGVAYAAGADEWLDPTAAGHAAGAAAVGGGYVYLHMLSNAFPGAKKQALVGLAAGITQIIRLMKTNPENLPCAMQRTLLAAALGSAHIGVVPALKFLSDAEFRKALAMSGSRGQWRNITKEALKRSLDDAWNVADETALKEIFDTGGRKWLQEHIPEYAAFLKKVIETAKAKGINIAEPGKTFDIDELDLRDELSELRFHPDVTRSDIGTVGEAEDEFLRIFIEPLNQQTVAKVNHVQEMLRHGLDEAAEAIEASFKKFGDIANAVNAENVKWADVKDKIQPMLREVVENVNKVNINRLADLSESIPLKIDETLAEAGNLLENFGITKDSDTYRKFISDYKTFLSDAANRTEDSMAASDEFIKLYKKHADSTVEALPPPSEIEDAVRASKLNKHLDDIVNSSQELEDSLLTMDLTNAAIADHFSNALRMESDEVTREVFENSQDILEKLVNERIMGRVKKISPSRTAKAIAGSAPVKKASEAGNALFGNILRTFFGGSKLGRRLGVNGLIGTGAMIGGLSARDASLAGFWDSGDERVQQLKNLGAKLYYRALMSKLATAEGLELVSSGERKNPNLKFSDSFTNFETETRVLPGDIEVAIQALDLGLTPEQIAFKDQATLDQKIRPAVIDIINNESEILKLTKAQIGSRRANLEDIINQLQEEARAHSENLFTSGHFNDAFDEYLRSWKSDDLEKIRARAGESRIEIDKQKQAINVKGFLSYKRDPRKKLDMIIVHESGVDSLQALHRVLQKNGTGVHYTIDNSKVYQYGDPTEVYYNHTRGGANSRSIGIELNHKYLGKNNRVKAPWFNKGEYNVPSSDMLEACWKTVVHVANENGIPISFGNVAGDNFSFASVAGGVRAGISSHRSVASGKSDGTAPILYMALRQRGFDQNGAYEKMREIFTAVEAKGPSVKVKLPHGRGGGAPSSPAIENLGGLNSPVTSFSYKSKHTDEIFGPIMAKRLRQKVSFQSGGIKDAGSEPEAYSSEGPSVNENLKEGVIKTMNRKDLQNLVKEILIENTGQGYAAYPYGSSVRDEEQPESDYKEDWKSFCLDMIRDEESRIEIAKVLVLDAELFEDILDLAGENQSIGEELIRKVHESKEKKQNV